MNACEPKTLGRYEILREIGRGAMGVVYTARDPVIGRTLAIKTVALPVGLDPARRTEFFERFAREARAAGILSHPGIVTVYDAGHEQESALSFIAMEYVPGCTLQEWIARKDPARTSRNQDIARQLAGALAYAHDRGIVHRDLKPANVLLSDDGSVKITDFGVARVDASDLTQEGQSIGSPAYMSPEQVLGRTADRRSDLFSFGVMLYEMLSGERPFRGADPGSLAYQIVHEHPISLRSLDRTLSPHWEAIVSRLMAKRPEDRYPDARHALEDLEALARGAEPLHAAPAPSLVERTVVDDAPKPSPPPVPEPGRDPRAGVTPAAGAPETSHLSSRALIEEMAIRGGAAGARMARSAAAGAASLAAKLRTDAAPRIGEQAGALARTLRAAWLTTRLRTDAAPRIGQRAGALAETVRAAFARLSEVARAFVIEPIGRIAAAARRHLLPAAALCLIATVAILGWFLVRPGALVAVELKHGLEEGRLEILMDGSEVLNRTFRGEPRSVRLLGQDLFQRVGGTLEDSFRIRPGEHEFVIKVHTEGPGGGWVQTMRRTIPRGSGTLLEIRAETTLARGLSVDWEFDEGD